MSIHIDISAAMQMQVTNLPTRYGHQRQLLGMLQWPVMYWLSEILVVFYFLTNFLGSSFSQG